MNQVEARLAFRAALRRAQISRRTQLSFPGEAAVNASGSGQLALRHALLIGEGYELATSVPCRLLCGRGFSITFTYRHKDATQPVVLLRLTVRDRSKRPNKRQRR